MEKIRTIILFFIGILIGGFSYYLLFPNNHETINNNLIKVEIKGAVHKPGVYELKEDSRVSDLIATSGGLTKDSDISSTNMSKRLTDEMVVIIYTKDEIKEMIKGSTSIKYIEKECICPQLNNGGCFDDIISNSESIVNKTGKISLNSGTKEELMSVPGIGEAKANDIIKYREQYGFKSIEDLMNVKGIGSATFDKIKDYFTL